jgi:hypothetical protein
MRMVVESVVVVPHERAVGQVFAMCEAEELIQRTQEGWELVAAWSNGTALLCMAASTYQEPDAGGVT